VGVGVLHGCEGGIDVVITTLDGVGSGVEPCWAKAENEPRERTSRQRAKRLFIILSMEKGA
jgi:hypothetical protein